MPLGWLVGIVFFVVPLGLVVGLDVFVVPLGKLVDLYVDFVPLEWLVWLVFVVRPIDKPIVLVAMLKHELFSLAMWKHLIMGYVLGDRGFWIDLRWLWVILT